MSRTVVDSVRMLPERTRFMKGIFAWVGYRQATVHFTRPPRAAGKTKWRLWPLWNFALEGMVSFTTLPLKIWSYIGFTSALVGLTYMIYIVGRTLFTGVDVPGYASLLSFVLLFNGLVLVGLGVMGEYIARIMTVPTSSGLRRTATSPSISAVEQWNKQGARGVEFVRRVCQKRQLTIQEDSNIAVLRRA